MLTLKCMLPHPALNLEKNRYTRPADSSNYLTLFTLILLAAMSCKCSCFWFTGRKSVGLQLCSDTGTKQWRISQWLYSLCCIVSGPSQFFCAQAEVEPLIRKPLPMQEAFLDVAAFSRRKESNAWSIFSFFFLIHTRSAQPTEGEACLLIDT